MEPEKKPKKHKKIKPIVINSIIFGVLLVAGICVYFFVLKKPEPEVILSDAQYLVKTEAWEKQDSPTVIWTFRADGTGELTTNKSNYYDTTWELTEENGAQTLTISTDWLYKLKDTFSFVYDREMNSFTVINQSDQTESIFVPLGTQAEKDMQEADKLEKTEE